MCSVRCMLPHSSVGYHLQYCCLSIATYLLRLKDQLGVAPQLLKHESWPQLQRWVDDAVWSTATATAEARSLDDWYWYMTRKKVKACHWLTRSSVSRSHIVNLSVSAGLNKTANYVYLTTNVKAANGQKLFNNNPFPLGCACSSCRRQAFRLCF